MNFWDTEPFIDWDGIDDQMAKDLREKLRAFRQAQVALDVCDLTEGSHFRSKAADLMRTQEGLASVVTAIRNTLYTVPMIVHVAGAKSTGHDEDGEERIVQRCKRCGSILQIWLESYLRMTPQGPLEIPSDDMVWWQEGEIVAKSASEDRQMYRVKDRELEDFERPCPDLTKLGT